MGRVSDRHALSRFAAANRLGALGVIGEIRRLWAWSMPALCLEVPLKPCFQPRQLIKAVGTLIHLEVADSLQDHLAGALGLPGDHEEIRGAIEHPPLPP